MSILLLIWGAEHSVLAHNSKCESVLMLAFAEGAPTRAELEVNLRALVEHVMGRSSDPDVLNLAKHIAQFALKDLQGLSLGSTAQELRNSFQSLSEWKGSEWAGEFVQREFKNHLESFEKQVAAKNEIIQRTSENNLIVDDGKVQGEKTLEADGKYYLRDFYSRLIWAPVASRKMKWLSAVEYCKALDSLGLKWRLPAREEFSVAFNSRNKTWQNIFFGTVLNEEKRIFWSHSTFKYVDDGSGDEAHMEGDFSEWILNYLRGNSDPKDSIYKTYGSWLFEGSGLIWWNKLNSKYSVLCVASDPHLRETK